ncbi:hypothetical protein CU102_03535 [Phyllobacterium brassicacearum]|uniref:Antifreeze protein n=1 Tax=Phyllobacterium brassicacearum TaxID=314235 RepID=A0A2P7BVI5_9HYPH|nr:hypothetical protein CU102_03535 [Phyllobacterium brassicacearum]
MSIIRNLVFTGVIAAASFAVAPAYALTAKECSAKYQAAKEAGTLGGLKWNDFRKAQCASDAAATTDTKKPASKTKTDTTTSTAKGTDDGDGLTMKECSAKYQAAKNAGTLGGLKWNDFRKSQCSADSAATAPATPTKTAKKAASSSDNDGDGLTMKECSAKYQAAKNAGTLGGLKWNDFRKAQCGAGASVAAKPEPVQPTRTATAPSDDSSDGGGLTMKECSAKYQAAKSAGTLGGMKWNDFRKAQCSASAAANDDETAPTTDTATYTQEPAAPTTAAPRGVAFPRGVSSKYSNESAGKARMHTCLDQYYANKESNSLGGLKWIQKGGGYYSLCNSRLKG